MMASAVDSAIEPREISQRNYDWLVNGMVALLTAAELIVAEIGRRALGARIHSLWIMGPLMLNVFPARLLVDRILKRFGRYRTGIGPEEWRTTKALPEGEVGDDAVVHVHCPANGITGLGLTFVAFFLAVACVAIMIPHDRINGLKSLYATIAIFGLGSAYFLYVSEWRKRQAWADASGVTGYPVGPEFPRRTFVPWSDVVTCEVETHYNAFGRLVMIRPVLKGCTGEVLLKLDLRNTKPADRERLVTYIKAKLPKS